MAPDDQRPSFSENPFADEAVYRAALAACTSWLRAGDAGKAVEALQDTMTRLERAARRGTPRRRRVLVVGGAGYIGSVLVRMLLRQNYEVRVLDNFLYGNALSLEELAGAPGFTFVPGDMRDEAVLGKALDGVSDVVLLASLAGDAISGKYPDLTRSVNTGGSEKLFAAMNGRGIHKFVFASTCAAYGLPASAGPATENMALAPRSVYAETKAAFETHILAHTDAVDFIPTVLRLATAFGPSPRMRFDLPVNAFTAALARGQRLDLHEADRWQPYCHVRDIAGAVIRVLEADEAKVRGEVFNVGSDGNNYTGTMIAEEALKHIDGEVTAAGGGSRAGPGHVRVSFDKIRGVLDFEPRHSVAVFVPELISAVRSGFYQRQDEMRDYYGNYAVRPDAAGL